MLVYRHARRAAACHIDPPLCSVIEEVEHRDTVGHPVQLLQGVVSEIENPTANVRIVRIRTDRPMLFSPGQYAKLRFVGGFERCYSIASVDGDGFLEFHIRTALGEGAGSQLASQLRIGDGLGVSGPHGLSHLRRNHDGPIICVAGGTGLAPVLSIVRGALETGQRHPVHLYYGEKFDSDVYAAAKLSELKKRYPNLTSHIVIDAGSLADGRRSGPLVETLAMDWKGDIGLREFRAYVGGSPAMAHAVRDMLLEKGLSPDRIHSDCFSAQSAAAA